jgi:hypothetical protein
MALIACVVVGVLGVVNKPIEFESDSSIGYSLEKFNHLPDLEIVTIIYRFSKGGMPNSELA